VPKQDPSGRWISDDGRFFWDGASWRPLAPAPQQAMAPPPASSYGYAAPPAPQGRSPWPGILIGCGIAAAMVLVLLIIGSVLMVNSPDFQRGFCRSYTKDNPNVTCPFHPSPAQ
jgi:hypothetical protein